MHETHDRDCGRERPFVPASYTALPVSLLIVVNSPTVGRQARIEAEGSHPPTVRSPQRFAADPGAEVDSEGAGLARFRFGPEICESLQKIAWWDWSQAQLAAALMDFRTLPIEQFCARYLDQAPLTE